MKSSAELQAELKSYRKISNKKIKKLKEDIKKAITYEETHPSEEILKQEAVMRAYLDAYIQHDWKKGDKGYFIDDFGRLACPCLEIQCIFKGPEGRRFNCGPWGPGIPSFDEKQFFTDALAAIANYYFGQKEQPDKHRLPPLLSMTREELLHIVREWYFETKEKLAKEAKKK